MEDKVLNIEDSGVSMSTSVHASINIRYVVDNFVVTFFESLSVFLTRNDGPDITRWCSVYHLKWRPVTTRAVLPSEHWNTYVKVEQMRSKLLLNQKYTLIYFRILYNLTTQIAIENLVAATGQRVCKWSEAGNDVLMTQENIRQSEKVYS